MGMKSKGLDFCPGICSATCMQQSTMNWIKKGPTALNQGFLHPTSLWQWPEANIYKGQKQAVYAEIVF